MLTLTINSRTHLGSVGQIPGAVLKKIRARLTFPNPAFHEAKKRGFWTGNLEREIKGYQVEGDAMVILRGFTRQLVGILHQAGVDYQIQDRRRTLPSVDFQFQGELRDF
jgi:hypothetical protein